MCIRMTELQKQSFGGVLQLYQKRDRKFFNFFRNTYFYSTPPVTASGIKKNY